MRIVLTLLISFTLLTTGCSWVKFPSVHKVEIKQGNIVDQEMIDKLLPGMTKSQVQFVLGTPLIADTFDQQRWDYYYSRLSPESVTTEERVTIYFDAEGNLERMTGDYLPTTAIPEER
ncbi:MAG: outer membrane protein assembly factor BamE [Porticoccaceae bacterium]